MIPSLVLCCGRANGSHWLFTERDRSVLRLFRIRRVFIGGTLQSGLDFRPKSDSFPVTSVLVPLKKIFAVYHKAPQFAARNRDGVKNERDHNTIAHEFANAKYLLFTQQT
jgi:hypothetical protein